MKNNMIFKVPKYWIVKSATKILVLKIISTEMICNVSCSYLTPNSVTPLSFLLNYISWILNSARLDFSHEKQVYCVLQAVVSWFIILEIMKQMLPKGDMETNLLNTLQ